jgi:hypothetical protein
MSIFTILTGISTSASTHPWSTCFSQPNQPISNRKETSKQNLTNPKSKAVGKYNRKIEGVGTVANL